MTVHISRARFAVVMAVIAGLFATGVVSGAAGDFLVIGGANQAGVSNTSLNTNSSGFAWQMNQTGSGVGVYAISANGNALAALAHNGNKYGLSVTNDGSAGTGAAIIADGRNNVGIDVRVNSNSIDPIKVNSTSMVDNLNADLLDGLQGNSLTRFAYNTDDNNALVGASGTVISTTITAPTRGWLRITASSDVFGTAASATVCNLDVDGTNIASSFRTIAFEGSAFEDDCSTNAGYFTCGGTHTVSLEASFVAATTTYDEANIEVTFHPYDGSGNRPSIFPCIIILPSAGWTIDN